MPVIVVNIIVINSNFYLKLSSTRTSINAASVGLKKKYFVFTADKFKLMAEKNPALLEFKKRFDLDIEY